MRNLFFFITLGVTLITVTFNQVQAQSFSLSVGPAIPVNDYGDDKPAAYQGNFIRIENFHSLKSNLLLGIGIEYQKISLKYPFKINDTTTDYYQQLTYLAIPITIYNEAITVHKGVVPFINAGTNVMVLVDNTTSGRSLNPFPVVFCATIGAGLKFNITEKFNMAIKGNLNQNINEALKVNQTRVTTFSLGLSAGLKFK